jgi:putative peptidoglycan lipid II flippase
VSNEVNSDQSRILSSSALMASGTIVSRLSGFVRSALLAAALGAGLHADVFNISNTIPNMLYILLAGGIFNAVLVPQLVRAMRNDPDGGEAYTNRVVTLAGLFLLTVTTLLVIAAPWVMQLFLDRSFNTPELAEQRDAVIDFARFCLPQVFFYGMFVLVGQILNARGKFGPMMWAPIANNIISVAVLVVYLFAFDEPEGAQLHGGFTLDQELVLGVGSTLGIAAQFLILVPYLKAAGFRYRPRFDFRNTGLGHTLRLGVWTVLFVVVNQVAYTIVVRLASSGTADNIEGTGYTVYAQTFLLVMVPHSVVTVSLATAILPRLSASAADADLRGLARTLSSTLRSTLVLIVPMVCVLPVVSREISKVVWGHGAAASSYENFVPSLALFAPGLLFFTVHYLMLRGFYALERTRTVFWVQCVVASTNIVLALVLVQQASAKDTSPALVLAYAGSYLVGASASYLLLRHLLGGLDTPVLVRFLVRVLIAAGLATLVAYGAERGLHRLFGEPGFFGAVGVAILVVAIDVVVFLALARVMRIREATTVLGAFTRRPPGSEGVDGGVLR